MEPHARARGGHRPASRGTPGLFADSLRKDLRTIAAEASDRGFSLPVSERTLAVFDEAAATGLGKRDCSLLPAYWAAKADQPADIDA